MFKKVISAMALAALFCCPLLASEQEDESIGTVGFSCELIRKSDAENETEGPSPVFCTIDEGSDPHPYTGNQSDSSFFDSASQTLRDAVVRLGRAVSSFIASASGS